MFSATDWGKVVTFGIEKSDLRRIVDENMGPALAVVLQAGAYRKSAGQVFGLRHGYRRAAGNQPALMQQPGVIGIAQGYVQIMQHDDDDQSMHACQPCQDPHHMDLVVHVDRKSTRLNSSN